MGTIWSGVKGVVNFLLKPDKHPEEVNDILCWQIGFASEDIKKGQRIMIKKSDGKFLMDFFKMYL